VIPLVFEALHRAEFLGLPQQWCDPGFHFPFLVNVLPLSLATDMMVWNVTKDKINERMATYTGEAWGVPGTAVQPPPEKGRPNPMSDFINSGKWKEGYDATNEMLDEHMKKYGLEDQDWRKGYWDK
jgi:ribonuclease Z